MFCKISEISLFEGNVLTEVLRITAKVKRCKDKTSYLDCVQAIHPNSKKVVFETSNLGTNNLST